MYQSHLNLRPTGDMRIPVPFGRSTKVSKPEVRQKLQRRVHRFLNLANLEADPSRDGDISKNPWYIFGMAFLESVWFRKTPASLGTSSSSEVAPVQMSCWKWRPDSSQFQKCLHFYHFWSGRIFMLHFVNPSAALLGGWHCCYGWQRHVMFLAVREHKTYQSWLMCLIILFLAEIFRHPSPRKAEASWCTQLDLEGSCWPWWLMGRRFVRTYAIHHDHLLEFCWLSEGAAGRAYPSCFLARHHAERWKVGSR